VSGNDAPIACAAGRVDGGNGERWTFGHGMFRGDRVMLHTHDPDALLHIEMGMMVPHPPQPPTPALPDADAAPIRCRGFVGAPTRRRTT